MATSKGQRVGIWIIAGAMFFGTLGSFFLPILVNDNASKEATEQQKVLEQLQQQANEQQKQAAAASEPLDGYAAEAFDAAAVTELQKEVIVEGEGKEATATSDIKANYFGWTSDGKIFDSSKKNGALNAADFNLGGVIKGWTDGLTGAKPGSTIKLVIPTDLAYGPNAAAQNRPVGPLSFIVQVVEVK